MSILEICQSATRYAGVNVPALVFGQTDEDALRLQAIAEMEIKSLARRHNWTVLQREHTFTTSDGDSDYALPSDFDRLINNTVWNRSTQEPASGPINNQLWQNWESGILQPVVNDNWRIFPTSATNQFHIQPEPSSTETLAFEYITNQPVESSGGIAQTTWDDDTDVPRLDDFLVELGMIWRLLRRYGFEHAAEHAEYENQVQMAIARDGGSKILSLAGPRVHPITAAYTPEAGFG